MKTLTTIMMECAFSDKMEKFDLKESFCIKDAQSIAMNMQEVLFLMNFLSNETTGWK